ncbi:MAG: serine/threonine protein kinase, partial [Pirellulaceae bacterium]|nr:serine/threonine protein kinase [Pirellulaceae bacterium]
MVSTSEFWRLAVESRLLTVQQVERLQSEFAQLKGASPHGSAAALVEWLVARNILSRYQTKILGGGRAGPFFYGDYRVYDRIESGPLSGMFRAVHVASNHPVLLQFLTGPVTNDPTRWTAAAARAARFVGLRHPHLARIHELVDLVTFKFVVLEDPTGRTLQQQLADAGRYPPAEACRLAWQLAQALAYLHSQGIVAGDLRASRVWVGDDGHARLLLDPVRPPEPPQFGGPDSGGELLERADYLAPEFTRPGKLPDPLTDIYALGCLTYQMLHGSPPFAGGDLTRKLQRHAKEPIAPLEPLGVPQPVAQIVAYAMAKNPTVRFPSADLVAQQLRPLVDPTRLAQLPAVPPTLAAFDAVLQQRHGFRQPATAAPAATAPAMATA